MCVCFCVCFVCVCVFFCVGGGVGRGGGGFSLKGREETEKENKKKRGCVWRRSVKRRVGRRRKKYILTSKSKKHPKNVFKLMIPSSRSLLCRDNRLPLDTWNQSGSKENFVGNQFSTFDLPKNYSQKIQSDDVHRNREAAPEAEKTKTSHTSEDRQKSKYNSNANICENALDHEFYNTGGISAELHGWTAKTANIGIAVRRIPYSTFLFMLEDKIQKPSACLF